MKNVIEYYYNLKNLYLYEKNNKIYLKDKSEIYILEKVVNIQELNEIYIITTTRNEYDSIIKNIYGNLYTVIKEDKYVLIKKNNIKINILEKIINNNEYIDINYAENLDRSDWLKLWQKKIDYYEYQYKYIEGTDSIIESFNYYIGMGETAISYIKYNVEKIPKKLVISHKRINKDNYYNPINTIIDWKARDVSEYLKYLFLTNNYRQFAFGNFFKKLNFNRSDFILTYARMLFPDFFFDVYDEIINRKSSQRKMLIIIKRTEEYEKYLNMIFNNINKIVELPEIHWLKKRN